MVNVSRFNGIGSSATRAPSDGSDIVSAAKIAADRDHQLVRDAFGLACSEADQLYRNGERMYTDGERKALAFRAEFEALPMLADALEQTREMIRAEKRADKLVPLRELYLDRDGVLRRDNCASKIGLVPSPVAMSSLASFAPKELRDSGNAQNINLWTRHVDTSKMVKVRTRNPFTREDGLELRACPAVVSEKYEAYDLDRVCETLLASSFPKDARGEITYDGSKWKIDAVLAPTFEAGEIGVGRVFRARSTVEGADDRRKGLWGSNAADRIRCKNCTIITDKAVTFRQRHTGDVATVLENAIAASAQAMAIFSEAWREANTRAIVDKTTGGTLEVIECFRRLIAHGYLSAIPGGKRGALDTLEGLMSAYEKEPLSGAAGVNAAITRYAHENASEWASVWTVPAIETQAGALLFERVYALPGLTDRHEEMFAAA